MIDRERIDRLKDLMHKNGFDVLLCRLPEHVLYVSGYWPVFGASLAVFTKEGETVLITPWSELDYTAEGWVKDIRTYRFINMAAPADPNRDMKPLLTELAKERNWKKLTIGYEGSFELVAANNVSAEARVPTEASFKMFKECFPEAVFKDASYLLKQARIIKSAQEIAQIKITNEIAAMGYETALAAISAGVSEAKVAAAVEARIYGDGVGYKNVTRARGYCFVMSGPNSANSWRPFCVSSAKPIRAGEPVLVELDTFSNGYFNDLTRTMMVGGLTEKARPVFKAVQEALSAVMEKIKPGVKAADLDALSRRVIEKHGYGQYFNHQLGHGIGLQFHEPPTLHPASTDVLEAGMVFAIEPAIYIPGWGGVRIEENIVVTTTGYESICNYPQIPMN